MAADEPESEIGLFGELGCELLDSFASADSDRTQGTRCIHDVKTKSSARLGDICWSAAR